MKIDRLLRPIQLGKRERYLVIAAGAAVALLLLLQFAVLPFFDSRSRYASGIAAKQAALRKIMALSDEYQALHHDSQDIKKRLAGRAANFTLFSFLEKAASESEIKNHIKYMKPSTATGKGDFNESLVEMKLEGVTLRQLAGYLAKIESIEDVVSIRRISIQQGKEENSSLDVVLQVLTYT